MTMLPLFLNETTNEPKPKRNIFYNSLVAVKL